MAGAFSNAINLELTQLSGAHRVSPSFIGAASYQVLSPVLILLLCVVAGIGTILLMPGKREGVLRRVGGVILIAVMLIFGALLARWVNALNLPGGHMSLYFWIFSAIGLISSMRVITHRKPVYSALYFVLTVLASAGIMILLWAEFVAVALIVIYAGAILVTYVFVIMLASPNGSNDPNSDNIPDYDKHAREPVFASAMGFALMAVLMFVIFEKNPVPAAQSSLPKPATQFTSGSVQAVGNYLFKQQVVNLEIAGLILTIAMVGAILIARRKVTPLTTFGEKEIIHMPATPIDDNPHSIPVYGTRNPQAKAYPEG